MREESHMLSSSIRFAILCIIFVSLFRMQKCENVGGFKRNKIFLPPCVRLYCHIGFSPDCYCCVGKTKFCSTNKEECWHQCPILNPPHSSMN
ncbi:hypothetical protein EUTSA_v10005199mg [Eutrema salsugineum]|uniref:Embryo surrounding factor 1 brassicaceae domain-containing protein n=1 Tax=Eutrema salsugineum TaxID=72664 RepID=V4K486_EUTSA|nr:hypothetical protein EUTSA_v10005199mg [Eutrema salsugineum]